MTGTNILPFPQPDHDLSPEALAERIFCLSDEIANILASAETSDLVGLLQRLEQATSKLTELGDLVLRGVTRIETAETGKELRISIERARIKLEGLSKPLNGSGNSSQGFDEAPDGGC